jgi:hypothetical protein
MRSSAIQLNILIRLLKRVDNPIGHEPQKRQRWSPLLMPSLYHYSPLSPPYPSVDPINGPASHLTANMLHISNTVQNAIFLEKGQDNCPPYSSLLNIVTSTRLPACLLDCSSNSAEIKGLKESKIRVKLEDSELAESIKPELVRLLDKLPLLWKPALINLGANMR